MKYSNVFLGIGSNVGERLKNIEKAIEFINIKQECEVIKVSSVYESKSFGDVEQNNFLNAVARIRTNLEPVDLFKHLKNIEYKIGRTKTVHWGPREIDLDILLYNDLVYADDKLIIPHKGIQERDFVMVPLTEIEPGIVHPVLKEKIDELLKKADRNIIGKISQ